MLSSVAAPQLRLDQVQRVFARLVPSASVVSAGGVPLELLPASDPPVLGHYQPLEPSDAVAREVTGAPAEGFAAFLDGTQRADVIGHTCEGEAVVLGSAGAVIRLWNDRHVRTWGHRRAQRVFAPLGVLGAADRAALQGLPLPVVDTVEPGDDHDAHPHARRDAALRAVRRMREGLEQSLLSDWVRTERRAIYVDGGLSASLFTPDAVNAVGVVKTHRTLYAEPGARARVVGLRGGERGPVFLVGEARGAPLASWYLRLHDPAAHDVFWGLVRVEIGHDPARSLAAVTAQADEVSRRVLAERTPTAHPDARWHTMAYGIRDCEVFLRATQ